MKNQARLNWMFLFLAAGVLTPQLRGGTVITTNLPNGSIIVNINAQTDGAAAYSQPNPPQSYWYQPSAGAPSVTLAAGTYQFRIINPTDASAMFSSLSAGQLGEIYTAWTFNSPWTDNYLAFNSTAFLNPAETQLFDGGLAPGTNPADLTFPSAQAAYDGTIANGYYNLIRPAPPGRAGTAADYLATFTLTTATTLVFVIPDNILGDNAGGVSVLITAVPEPSTLALAAAGSLALAVRFRRRRR